jgi:hypothetical protein
MASISIASNVLAPRYPMTCTPEDYASKALATDLHLRREEEKRGKAPTPPSQGKVGSGAQGLTVKQHGVCRVPAWCPSGAGIKPAPWNHLALAGRAVTRAKANDRVTVAAGNANARTVSTAYREVRHALA